MKNHTIELFFALLRSALTASPLNEAEKISLQADQLSPLLELSKKHDVAHLVCVGLTLNRLLDTADSVARQFLLEQNKAVYRYERRRYDLEQIAAVFEREQIPFLPLKGAVLQNYYPEPWQRTSCDLDILVPAEKLSKACELLSKKHGYSLGTSTTHDRALYSVCGTHLELHFQLVEEGRARAANAILADIWERVTPAKGSNCRYEMPPSLLYFYQIAHMAKHFENGGCGVRALLDFWLLKEHFPEILLSEGGLLPFAKAMQALAAVWLEGGEETEQTRVLTRFLLQGNAYGSLYNRVAVGQTKRGGKIAYARSRIWLPYEELRKLYPSLEGKKWLLPVYECRRWWRILLQDGAKKSIKELKINAKISKAEESAVRALLEELGL